MDHPNIAKVLDAGSTESGHPFFVMELVKGIPVTDYCDQHRLGMPDRLMLFRQICSAVQHAHQKGIIHRDLKPSNILVESHDDKPVPKVIDFGLAKATSGLQLSEYSLYTAFGSVAGTPLYMAPEQATFNAIDVDTRADIYALGVILYEMMTGSTPIQRDTFKRAALDEILRVIREVEPPTPSSRLGTAEALPSLAANRRSEPARLSRFMRGDLDWIVMKALSKDRRRRYDSAIGLANDVERFLNHEPVSAGPPTAAYRLQKFVRRNRVQVVAASLVLLAMVAGIVGTTLGLVEADGQRKIADARAKEAEKRLAQKDKANEILLSVFRELNPDSEVREDRPLSERLGKRLDVATAALEGEATDDPLGVAAMQLTLGQTQLGLGYPEKAIVLFAKARATFAARLGADRPETLSSTDSLAMAYMEATKHDLARPLFEETLTLRRARLGPDHPDTLVSMFHLAYAYQFDSVLDLALPLYQETLALMKAKLGPDDPETLNCMGSLANAYRMVRKLDLALPLFEQVFELTKSKFGPNNLRTLSAMLYLAVGYRDAGRLDRAIPLFEETLALMKAHLGPDHTATLSCMGSLAAGYGENGNLNRSLVLFEETLALQKVNQGPGSLDTLLTMMALARGYREARNYDRAISLLLETLALMKAHLGPDNRQTIICMSELAGVYRDAGEPDRAVPLWHDAEPTLRKFLVTREAKEPDDWMTFHAKSWLGEALLGQKKYADAEPLLEAGYEGMKQRAEKIPPGSKKRIVGALDRLIELSEATHKLDDAKMWRDEKAKTLAPPPEPKTP